MKLLVTGIDPPDEISSWSGIPYHLSQSLGKHFELCFVGGLRGPNASRHKLIEAVNRRLGGRSYRIRSEPSVLEEFSNRLQEVINRERPDAVLSISCEPIAYLKPGLPAFLVHDSTFRLLSETYPHFQVLCKRSQKTGEEAQRLGFARATLTLAASDWARESACSDYGLPPSKVKVLPMAANLLDPPGAEEVAAAVEERLASGVVEFLFVGVEWGRKGGDTAVSIVEALVRRGLNSRLHLVGCPPPASVLEKPFVTAHGFLSKKNATQAVKLRNLFKTASFFIVPSVAEAFGCVFCEANAFGTPCLSRAAGGIPQIIKNGENGFLISDALTEEQIVDAVYKLSQDPEQYRQMAVRSRAHYETRLNWDVYASRLKEILQESLVDSDQLAVS